MIKNIIGGIAVGIANIIPGVSGGTMLVVLGIFDRMMEAISGLVKKDNPNRKNDILFVGQVLAGTAIGLVGFANVLNFLFANFPTQTLYWFVGLIAFSIPMFLNDELKGEKVNWLYFLIGFGLIFLLQYLNPGESNVDMNPVLPSINLGILLTFIVIGIVSGATMIMPGVSGSMVLLILGYYYLFKTYVSSVTSFSLTVLIPLSFAGVGILIGIFGSSKICAYSLKHYKREFLSIILGLISASALVLIPLDVTYNLNIIISSLFSLVFGGLVVLGLTKLH